MCIQRKLANELKIKFYANFVNIRKSDDDSGDLDENESHLKSPIICTDEQRVMQVLLGLQSNALKFTRKGMVSIHVDIQEVENQNQEKDEYLRIKVIDTGSGIPLED